jgi:hypothetical protein
MSNLANLTIWELIKLSWATPAEFLSRYWPIGLVLFLLVLVILAINDEEKL